MWYLRGIVVGISVVVLDPPALETIYIFMHIDLVRVRGLHPHQFMYNKNTTNLMVQKDTFQVGFTIPSSVWTSTVAEPIVALPVTIAIRVITARIAV